MSNSQYEQYEKKYFRFLEAFIADKDMSSYVIRGGAAVKILFQSERLSQDFDFVYQPKVEKKSFDAIAMSVQRISDSLGLRLTITRSENKILISPPGGIPFFEIVDKPALTTEVVLWKGKTVLVETPEELLADKIALIALRPDGPYGVDIVDIATILSSTKVKPIWEELFKKKYNIKEIRPVLNEILGNMDELYEYCCLQIINFVPGFDEIKARKLIEATAEKIKRLIK